MLLTCSGTPWQWWSILNMWAEEYTDNEQICVSNGQGLIILHTSLAKLLYHIRNFHLQTLLHVFEIQKNLISAN